LKKNCIFANYFDSAGCRESEKLKNKEYETESFVVGAIVGGHGLPGTESD
jgi:hypothetical protein